MNTTQENDAVQTVKSPRAKRYFKDPRKPYKINQRPEEAEYENSYQVIFRTNRQLSAEWSKLRGICKRFGHNETSPEFFKAFIMPAMRKYVEDKGYVGRARAARKAQAKNVKK